MVIEYGTSSNIQSVYHASLADYYNPHKPQASKVMKSKRKSKEKSNWGNFKENGGRSSIEGTDRHNN